MPLKSKIQFLNFCLYLINKSKICYIVWTASWSDSELDFAQLCLWDPIKLNHYKLFIRIFSDIWIGNNIYKINLVAMTFIVEQVLLDQNSQTPPPSPFSVQAFNKGATCSAQGFDYGLGNNKGRRLSESFPYDFSKFSLLFLIFFFPHSLIKLKCMHTKLTLEMFKRCSFSQWIVLCHFRLMFTGDLVHIVSVSEALILNHYS